VRAHACVCDSSPAAPLQRRLRAPHGRALIVHTERANNIAQVRL
jgi:hypothetical protein